MDILLTTTKCKFLHKQAFTQLQCMYFFGETEVILTSYKLFQFTLCVSKVTPV